MRLIARLSIPVMALMLALPAGAAKVYKWQDDEGVTHYTEQAPSDREYQLISTSGAAPADAEKAKRRLEEARTANDDKASMEMDYAEQQKQRDEEAKVRKENCDNAKANLKTMEEHARIRVMGDDGKFRYLSDEEKQKQLDRAKAIIKENCET